MSPILPRSLNTAPQRDFLLRQFARKLGRHDLADGFGAPAWRLIDDNAHPKAAELAELMGEEVSPQTARIWRLGSGGHAVAFHDDPKMEEPPVGDPGHLSEAGHGVRMSWVRVPGIWELNDPAAAFLLAWETVCERSAMEIAQATDNLLKMNRCLSSRGRTVRFTDTPNPGHPYTVGAIFRTDRQGIPLKVTSVKIAGGENLLPDEGLILHPGRKLSSLNRGLVVVNPQQIVIEASWGAASESSWTGAEKFDPQLSIVWNLYQVLDSKPKAS